MATTGFKDYYATLGVSKLATADEIKQAFRRLARKHHPDVNPGDKSAEAKFKEINEAYEVLSDSDKRRKYDQYGQYWDRMGSSSGAPGGAGFDPNSVDFSQYGSFDDFVNELLGRFGNTPGAQGYSYRGARSTSPGGFNDFSGYRDPAAGAGQDLESALSLTLAEAFHGVERRFSLGNETLSVRIPAGVKTGSRIRVKEKGQINPVSRRRGDLYLVVELKPHSFFKFEGDNLTCELPITPDEAVLGAAVEVPTLDGSVTMNIPANVRSGQTLRLRGKGWRTASGERSDQMVRLMIVPPPALSDSEHQLYEQLRSIRSSDPRSSLKQMRL
ncbi:MAG: DnaJ domain-containing protein [Pegethrix bostrychoides GSE-TBD4-15B]|jgi:curved DNA-binding protein|uniref:DnaJ domain-containing protein n=1 Tax=Pegethrix bostrychoides GSE-TBD4-15B TaxID=2839662 RepID=A0A951PE51_9CYAN|nr:DnaJ domain-containing protein [Pegethrix bostrychoides GSE-TBD4-15B]